MARKKTNETKRPIESYEHKGKQRVNNPPVGLVTPDTDPDAGQKKTYAYDPHLDPQLVWAGKAEHTSFDVPTVSLGMTTVAVSEVLGLCPTAVTQAVSRGELFAMAIHKSGGESGVRTHGAVISSTHDFQSCSFGQLGHLSA